MKPLKCWKINQEVNTKNQTIVKIPHDANQPGFFFSSGVAESFIDMSVRYPFFGQRTTKKPLTRRPRAEQEHFSGRMLLYTAVMAIKNPRSDQLRGVVVESPHHSPSPLRMVQTGGLFPEK